MISRPNRWNACGSAASSRLVRQRTRRRAPRSFSYACQSGKQVRELCEGPQGLLAITRAGQTVVDLGTSPLSLSRELAGQFAQKGVAYADAPVARTRQAAEDGTLAITVGASADVFARIEPLLRCFASEVTHCGDVGSGQLVKIMNNMVIVATVVALSEAAAIANSAGLETRKLFDAFAKGSADSFALRNHGFKAVAAGEFPKRAFSTEYMLKDITYALQMAEDMGIAVQSAEIGRKLLSKAIEQGFGADYWPVISKLIANRCATPEEELTPAAVRRSPRRARAARRAARFPAAQSGR